MSLISPLEKQAAALDEILQMHNELTEAKAKIVELTRELDRAEDRIVLLSSERLRLRKEAMIFRDKVVELATSQANMNLLAERGKEIMLTVTELLDGVDGHEEEIPTREAVSPRVPSEESTAARPKLQTPAEAIMAALQEEPPRT